MQNQRYFLERRTKGPVPFPAPVLLTAMNAVCLAVVLLFGRPIFDALDWQMLSIVVLVSVIFAGWTLARMFAEGVWSLSFLLYLVTALFHAGLYVGPAFYGVSTETGGGVWTDWINASNMRVVGVPILIAFFSFSAFAGLGSCLSSVSSSTFQTRAPLPSSLALSEYRAVSNIGSLLVVAGVGSWSLICFVALGPLFLTSTYEHFLDSTRTFPMGVVYLVITIGAVLLAQDPFRPLGKLALIFLLAFLFAGFVIGLRGETLMPVVGGLAVYARLNRMPSTLTFVGASILILLAIAAVAQVRGVGLGGLQGARVSVGPLDGVEEMGYSVRPLVASIDWHENAGEDYMLGSTYWAPLERGLSTLVGAPVLPAENDYRLMNVEIAQRVGQIGGSIIAEAHHNFGNYGIVAVLGLTGLISGRVSGGKTSALQLGLMGIFAVMILMHIRNSFAPLPLWGSFGIVCLIAAITLGRAKHLTSSRSLDHIA